MKADNAMNKQQQLHEPPADGKSSIGKRTVEDYSTTLRGQPELEERLLRSQRLEALGRLSSEVAHDFNNLLTVILGNAQMVLDGLSPVVQERAISEILQAAQRAEALTRQLLSLSRNQPIGERVIDLNRQILALEALVRRLLGGGVELVTNYASTALVRVEPTLIQQILLNLAVNAKDAMPHGGTVTIETADFDPEKGLFFGGETIQPGKYVRLVVSDTGIGMTPRIAERVFEPFFSTKPQGRNTGLGLATVRGVVDRSGGHISVRTALGQGTAFSILLPAATEGDIHHLGEGPIDVTEQPSMALPSRSSSEEPLLSRPPGARMDGSDRDG
jgi:signal transduction histidine kinase